MDILHRVGIKASADAVYQALATRAGLAAWWTEDTQGESAVGGALRFRFHADGREIGGFDMQVLELKPGAVIVWRVVDGPPEWVGTEIRFDLKTSGEFCIVHFEHRGWREPVEFMYHCSTKWAVYLISLKALVETGKGRPSPDDVRIGDWH